VKRIRAYPGLSDVVAYEDLKKIVPEASDRTEALRILNDALEHPEATHGMLALEIELL
jgi:ASC-1-like (ASCH) protein